MKKKEKVHKSDKQARKCGNRITDSDGSIAGPQEQ